MLEVFNVRRSADSDDVLKSLNGQFYKTKTISADAISIEDVESGGVIFMTAGGDDYVVNLPVKAKGLYFTFVMANASGGSTYRINPDDNASIIGYVSANEGANADATTADGLVSVLDGTDGKYIQLTKATGHKGNYISLCCDGEDWYVVGGTGTWAHEA
jgi:WD40 repeat protein